MGRVCRIEAPCKVNARLRIGARRPDGFHDLESVFLCLGFGDTVFLEEGGKGGDVEVLTEPPGVFSGPAEGNLAWRAAALFREASGRDRGLRIRLVKRVPLGGGLGGGSSDAAAVLRGLDFLAGTGFSREGLLPLAERLGSDVPFFLSGGAALVSGRGERIAPFPFPGGLWFVLVNPGFPSSTGEAFARLDAFRAGRGEVREPGAENGPPGADPAAWVPENDFLPVFRAGGGSGGVYDRMIGDLKSRGAVFAGLSGAGSSCFGVFPKEGEAKEAEDLLGGRWPFVRSSFFLAHLPLPVVE